MIWLAVAVGGALGAVCRYAISLYWPAEHGSFPWATLSANALGALLIGIFYVLLVEKSLLAPQWQPLITVGFLGALTTFSSFALDAVLLWQQGQGLIALGYIVTSLLLCLLLARVGIGFTRVFL